MSSSTIKTTTSSTTITQTIKNHQTAKIAFHRKLDFFREQQCTAKRLSNATPTTTTKTTDITAKYDFIRDHDITLGARLGSGGFGTVHECRIGGHKYALKRFHNNNTRNARAAQESFSSEQAATKLIHRNIVRSLFTFVRHDSRFVLMEFVEARTLQSIIDDDIKESLGSQRCIKFARQISAGLAYAHAKKIVHLDLKPLNILVTQSTDECKIADFGCCKDLTEIAAASPGTPTKTSLTGTYSYRAPELLRGEPATEKADIYSLGICLWQMVTRQRPYGNENHQVIIFKVVAYNLRPAIPEDTNELYKQVMVQCWDQCKDKRMCAKNILNFFNENF